MSQSTNRGARKSKTPVLIGMAFVLGVLAVLVYSTMSLSQHRVEVCMQYNGRTNCSVASGKDKEFVLRTATNTACALIASGVTETRGCEMTPPASVKWLE